MQIRGLLFVLLYFSLAPYAALAEAPSNATKTPEKRVVADTPERFAETRKAIVEDMGKGGRYEFLRPEDRQKVESDLDVMGAILEKDGSVGAMSEDDRVRLF